MAKTIHIETSLNIDANNQLKKASFLLAEHTGLSQAKIKSAMQKGAVWLVRGCSKKRIRRASKSLRLGDVLELNYDEQILNKGVPEPQMVHDAGDYSVWFKPYGVYCQGSRWGDFASISRWVESYFVHLSNSTQRSVYLVHRLDRATTGLILLCHSKNAARLFSKKFAERSMDKRYQAIVHGDFSVFPEDYKMEQALAGKTATSLFSFVEYKNGTSLVDVKLLTGRKHQIRQHLSHLGFPIVGDRLYGNEETPDRDLQLQSVSLEFFCPITQEQQKFSVAAEQKLIL